MSSEDEVRPYHAASGSKTADTLAEVLEHAAAREEAAHKRMVQKKQAKWVLPLGVNLGVFDVYLLIAPPEWVVMDPIEGPPPAEQEEGLRMAMYLQSQRIETYRIANGRLPEALSDAGSTVVGVDYRRQGQDGYQLVADVGETVLIYDSTESALDFARGADSRMRGG